MVRRASTSSPAPATSPTTSARSSCCSPTCSGSRCWSSASTTGARPRPPSRPCSARSSSRARRDFDNGDDIARRRARASRASWPGRVLSVDGEPIAGARIEVWQADEDGFYDVQYADLDEPRGRGHLTTGRRRPLLVLVGQAGGVPDPRRRPGRRPARAPAGAARCARPTSTSRSPRAGFQTLITHVFVEGDEYLGLRRRVRRAQPPDRAVRAPRAGRRHPTGGHPDAPFWTMSRLRPGAAPRPRSAA